MAFRPHTRVLAPGHWFARDLLLWFPLIDPLLALPAVNRFPLVYGTTTITTTGSPSYVPTPDVGASATLTSAGNIGIAGTSAIVPTEGSVAGWVKLRTATPTDGNRTGFPIVWHHTDNQHYPWTDGTAYIGVLRNTRLAFALSSTVLRTDWHHVAISAKSSGANTWRFFQNGRLVYSASGTSIPSEYRCTLLGLTYWVDGWCADLAVWNRALSDAEIYALWAPESRWSHYWEPTRRIMIDLAGTPAVGQPAIKRAGGVPFMHTRSGLFVPRHW